MDKKIVNTTDKELQHLDWDNLKCPDTVNQITEKSFELNELIKKMVREQPGVARQYFESDDQQDPDHWIKLEDEDAWYDNDIDVVVTWEASLKKETIMGFAKKGCECRRR